MRKDCLVFCIFYLLNYQMKCDENQTVTISSSLSTIDFEQNLLINNQTSSLPSSSYIIEPIYYDYELGHETLPDENHPIHPSNNPPPDIYPDPDKIYLRLKEIKEDELFKLGDKHNEVDDTGDNFDKDMKGHDLIDNIMYIYYGANSDLRKGLGGNVIVIGAVLGLAAQILAIALSFLRNRRLRRVNNALFPISINLLAMLCASNFFFIIGVQSSRNAIKCEVTAVLLHYLHLSTAVWGLIYILTIYQFIKNEIVLNLRNNYFLAYLGPGVYVMVSYAISSQSYETHNYCWMSVQRGMIVNFMVPISILIIISTVLGTMTLRKIVAKQRQVIGESIESIIESATTKYELSQAQAEQPIIHSPIPTPPTSPTQHQTPTSNLLIQSNNYHSCNEILDQRINESQQYQDEDMIKSKLDLYDSKFNLAALSLADLSLQSASEIQDFADFKKAIRFSLFFETTFSVCWFLGVVALENSQTSCIMPVIYIICYNIMSWYILIKISIIFPMINITTISSSTTSSQSIKNNQFNSSNVSLNKSILLLSSNNSPVKGNKTFSNFEEIKTKCADTIPLLCSTSSGLNNNLHISLNSNQNDHLSTFQPQSFFNNNWDTINLDSNKISSTNFDCISTISS